MIVKNSEIVVFLASIFIASGAIAQEAEVNSDPEKIDEVVVYGKVNFFQPTKSSTASRLNLDLIDTPQSISSITGDILTEYQLFDVDEISGLLAGIESRVDTLGEAAGLIARGFPMDGRNGYKINGVSTFRTQPLDLVVVDRIEFLKGPSGIMFGRNSYGGVLNVLTKKPGETSEASATIFVGDEDFKRAEADVTMISEDGRFGFRLPVAGEVDNYLGKQNRTMFTFAPSIRYEIGANTDVEILAIYQKWSENLEFGWGAYAPGTSSAGFSCAPPVECETPPDNYRDVSSVFDWNRFDVESNQVVGILTHEISQSLRARVGAAFFDTDSLADQSFIFGTMSANDDMAFFGDRVQFDQTGYNLEVSLSGEFDAIGKSHSFYVGADYWDSDETRELACCPFLGFFNLSDLTQAPPAGEVFTTFPAGLPNWEINALQQDDRTYTGVSAEVLLRPTDRISILLGGRWERTELLAQQISLVVPDPNAPPPMPGDPPVVVPIEFLNDQSITSFIPRVGITYSLIPDVLTLYSSYAEGYLPQIALTRDLTFLDPEVGEQIEIGIKGSFLDGQLGFSFAAFEIERTNVASPDPDNTLGESFSIGGLSQKNRGIEVELIGRPFGGLSVIGQFSNIDANQVIVGSPGKVQVPVPGTSYGIHGLYEFDEGALKGFAIGAGFSHVGKTNASSTGNLVLPGYDLANVNFTYRPNDKYVFRVAVKNVFDEVYFRSLWFDLFDIQFGEARRVVGSVTVNF